MWECDNCGCRAIAASVESCPMCNVARPTLDAVADSGESVAFPAGEAAAPSPPKSGKAK